MLGSQYEELGVKYRKKTRKIVRAFQYGVDGEYEELEELCKGKAKIRETVVAGMFLLTSRTGNFVFGRKDFIVVYGEKDVKTFSQDVFYRLYKEI